MITSSQFRDLCSGRRQGVAAKVARGLMHAAEIPYTAAVQWRNWRYDRQHATIHRLPIPVVSVGNLTLGGTGKTPISAWLARWFQARGRRVALVSRGYGTRGGGPNDEARELALALPGVPHVQDPDRVAAAQQAVTRHAAQIVLLDDGFQHRRLARDLDIVLIDALLPFGYQHVFPRGMLREPVAGLRRADMVIVSRADLVDPQRLDPIWQQIAGIAPHAVRIEAAHAPHTLVDVESQSASLDSLSGQRLAAFCGIGNPAGFRETLLRCGLDIAAWREFPDHHPYSPRDLQALDTWVQSQDATAVLCTRKDLVKIGRKQVANRPLWAVAIETRFPRGQAALEKALAALLAD